MIMITLGVIQEIFVSKIFVQFYFCVEKFFEVGTHENLNFSPRENIFMIETHENYCFRSHEIFS